VDMTNRLPKAIPLGPWAARAACAGMAPDMFFPTDRVLSPKDEAALWSVCFACPVRRECLDHGLHHRQESGVWGATTEAQRASLRKFTCARCRSALMPEELLLRPTWPACGDCRERRRHAYSTGKVAVVNPKVGL